MNRAALVTVVTVVKNAREALALTKESLMPLAERLSWIVIDGGSTDGTVEEARKESPIHTLWVSEPDDGIYDAMNKGWRLADEMSYVLFLGAGDKLVSLPAPDELNAGADAIFGTVCLSSKSVFLSHAGWRLRMYNTLHHQGLMVRRDISPEPPFDTQFPTYADFDFNQRLYLARAKFAFSRHFVSTAAPGGVSSRFRLKENLAVVRKNFGFAWAAFTVAAYVAIRVIPPLDHLRPIKPCI